MENILLIGASDHCKYTLDIIEQERKYTVYGILDKNMEKGETFHGYQIVGYLEEIKELLNKQNIIGGIVAIGDNYTRMELVREILDKFPEFEFVNAIHPSAITGKDVKLGRGCVLMAGVIINNNSKIGDHCFLATKSSLDHDSELGDYSSLSPGVTTGGRVIIGKCSAIGIGATILHYKRIGDNCVIGGNSLVTKDIKSQSLAFGIPAQIKREREADEKYL